MPPKWPRSSTLRSSAFRTHHFPHPTHSICRPRTILSHQSSPTTFTRYFSTSPSNKSPTPSKADSLPLSGTLVISLEQAIAAPLCTRHLADQGARILKIERPLTGDFNRHHDCRVKGLCSHFVWTNRSKESLALDLKNSKDLNVLKKLISKADVFIQNLAPGAAERMGLGYGELKQGNEGLIVCDISGYGSSGPYKHKKAYDALIQAESGFLSITGTPSPSNEPVKAGIPIADIAAGTTAYNSILTSLIQRGKTGRGCRIDISMLECMAEWMSFPLYYAYEGQEAPKMSGAEHASIYPYGAFECGAGGKVMLGMQNEREWKVFVTEVLKKEELLDDERFTSTALRSENRKELKRIIEDVFKDFSAEEVLEKLERNGIANANVTDMAGLWAHPQLQARERWTEVQTEKGSISALKPAGMPEGQEARMDPVPKVGEHGEEILREFGIER